MLRKTLLTTLKHKPQQVTQKMDLEIITPRRRFNSQQIPLLGSLRPIGSIATMSEASELSHPVQQDLFDNDIVSADEVMVKEHVTCRLKPGQVLIFTEDGL